MTIQIELDQELEELLATQARLQGIPLERHAGNVLHQALTSAPSGKPRATPEEFRAFLDAMAFSSEGTKLAAGETFDRESIYGDHA